MYHLANPALATPGKIAALFLPSGRKLTFAELDAEANRAANELLALSLPAERIGLYYVLASTKLSSADLSYIVRDADAKVAILSSRLPGQIDAP
ncbi:hypothetical protein [Variovorax sp. E3]|uniref:hypothetical protein n=1 Tax=Variovorax sp. E3 TaxID=1914993 RepID=UPI0018DD0D5D|nr:hypothetical protein [Variovorax sp. E3]